MKKIQYNLGSQLLLAVAMFVAGMWQPVFAFTYNGLNYSVVSGNTVKVASQGKSASLSGKIEIPSTVTNNGSSYSVTEIEGDAFIECKNITEIVVPETVTTIGGGSFAYCSSLKTLDLGSGVTTIGADLYTGLSALQTVISRNTTPPSIRNWGTVKTGATLYVPESAIDAYKKASIWSYFSKIEALSSEEGGDNNDDDADLVFTKFGFQNIRTLTVGNLVEEITPGSFSDCVELKEIRLGSGLKKIGDKAFSGCTGLTEIVVPPSVDSIGASAFAGNSNLVSIIMGHSVKVIGEKAFDLCPAQTVSVTAQTPPKAPNNTFSNYTGKLYVQGKKAADAYYDAYTCWDRFDAMVMIEPTQLKMENDQKLIGKPGDTFQLTAKLYPEDVTLTNIFWRSTNPDIATVDPNGLVTLHADMSDIMAMAEGDDSQSNSCKIIAESLYANGPVAEIEVTNDTSGIEDVVVSGGEENGEIDFNQPVEVYSINGMRVAASVDGLPAGFYVVRQGKAVKKIVVR